MNEGETKNLERQIDVFRHADQKRVGEFDQAIDPIVVCLKHFLSLEQLDPGHMADLKSKMGNLQACLREKLPHIALRHMDICKDTAIFTKNKIRLTIKISRDAKADYASYSERVFDQETVWLRGKLDKVKMERNLSLKRVKFGAVLSECGAKILTGNNQDVVWLPGISQKPNESHTVWIMQSGNLIVLTNQQFASMTALTKLSDREHENLAIGFEGLMEQMYHRDDLTSKRYRSTYCWKCKRSLNSNKDPVCLECLKGGFQGLICRCGACMCGDSKVDPARRPEWAFIQRLGPEVYQQWLGRALLVDSWARSGSGCSTSKARPHCAEDGE
ncbi:MAG: hypothetical protein JJ974_05865 [Phycisphaerales bacterium]|nr:hypothetical protein [Phycisphaerales bacterium]